MASNYLQYSVMFPIKKDFMLDLIAIDKELNQLDEMEKPEWSINLKLFGQDFLKAFMEDRYLGFSTELDVVENTCCIYCEEYGEVERAALYIQMLLRLKIPTVEHVLLQWAEYCSKPRPFNFGGGACLIIKDKIIWQENAEDWANREIKTRQACQNVAALYPE